MRISYEIIGRRPYVNFSRIALSSNMTTQLPFQPDILAIVLSHWRTMQSDKNFCTTTIPHENRILCIRTLKPTYFVFQFLCKKKHKLLKSSSFCKFKVEFKFSKYIKFNQSSQCVTNLPHGNFCEHYFVRQDNQHILFYSVCRVYRLDGDRIFHVANLPHRHFS